METISLVPNWTSGQKVTFRFLAIYLLLYICSNQFFTVVIFNPIWEFIIPFVGKYILQLPEGVRSIESGSGDGMFAYVSIFTYLLFAIIGTAIWTFLDKNRTNYQTLLDWLITLVRYYVAFQMLIYGMAKLVGGQFGSLIPSRLIQTYGDSSPMRLLWTFMAASKGYQMFTGVAEVLGGIFLLWKRTTTIGALTVFGVMANVMALNFFYDVPVKLLSTHLVIMALLLIALDGKRLLNFFFKNEPTLPQTYRELIPYPLFLKTKSGLKILLLLVMTGGLTYMVSSQKKMMGMNSDSHNMKGVYEVTKFSKNGKAVPITKESPFAWEYMTIDFPGRFMIQNTSGSKNRFKYQTDSTLHYMAVGVGSDSSLYDTFQIVKNLESEFFIKGTLQGDTIAVEMNKKSFDDFLLTNRGFHWVSEYPFNR